VQARIDALLEGAFIMPDGRRVFKSEDGQRVYDEFGKEVGRDGIDPDLIPDGLPAWESYEAETDVNGGGISGHGAAQKPTNLGVTGALATALPI
ncbi:MAG: hypothetical protein AAGJ28_21455, partial [Pseudomonadota bacterium]